MPPPAVPGISAIMPEVSGTRAPAGHQLPVVGFTMPRPDRMPQAPPDATSHGPTAARGRCVGDVAIAVRCSRTPCQTSQHPVLAGTLIRPGRSRRTESVDPR
jgi:hypothetical protein